jgi:integrase
MTQELTDLSPQTPVLPAAFENVAGQLSESSQRIYKHDAIAFATWLRDHDYELTRESVILYRHYLGQNYKPTTAKRMWSVVCRILEEQVHSGKLEKNPAKGVRGFKAQGNASKHIALQKEQANALLAATDRNTKKGKRDYAIMLLLLKTGLRRFECAALNIGDMRMEQGHHTLFLKETKGEKLDTVKMAVDVHRAILDYLESVNRSNASPDEPIFKSFRKGDIPLDKRISPNDIYRAIKKYAEIAGITDLTAHGLRATFITLSIEGGAPLHKVQYAARHSDPRMTEHYQKRKLNLDDNAVDYIHL